MESVTFDRWRVSVDVAATRKAYAAIEQGAAERCGCGLCLNYAAARDRAFPPRVIELLTALGIDWRLEGDVFHHGRMPSGLHGYQGWYHFVGRVESGDDAWKKAGPEPESGYSGQFQRVADGTEVGFSNLLDPPREPFAGQELVSFVFSNEVPWLLAEPYDGPD